MGTPPSLPRQRAQRSGCVTALLIVAGVVTALLITAFVSAWLFLRSDTGQRVVGVIREGVNMGIESTRAPGTDALRAMGCSEAAVMSMERMFDLIAEMAPEVRDDPDAQRFGGTMVVCQVDAASTGPDCSEVARTYSEAVADGPERFMVTVHGRSGRNARCQGIYGRDGTLLEEMDGDRPRSQPPASTDDPSSPPPAPPAPPPADVPLER